MSNVSDTDARVYERGAVSIKVVLGLLLAVVAAFLVMKLAPVYIEEQKVVHDVNELARVAAIRGWPEDRIAKDIKRLSSEYSLPEDGINLLSRGEKGVQIALRYERSVDLLVTSYAWKVDYTALGKDL